MTASLVSRQQFQLEIMNDDDLTALEELRKLMESGGHIMVDSTAKDSYEVASTHRDLGDSLRGMVDVGHGVSASKSARETLFGSVPRERGTIIQSIQRVSPSEFMGIPKERREEFLDHVKEKALQGMIEQADLINAVSYEEGVDPITHEQIIIAKLKVIIE